MAQSAEDILAAKWSIRILRTLANGPARFNRIRALIPAVAPNILTARLRELEIAGVVHRYALPPPARCRVYALTALGQAAKPIMRALADWEAHFANLSIERQSAAQDRGSE